MKLSKYLILGCVAVMASGCSNIDDSEDIDMPVPDEPGLEEVDTREYDSRFPFPVWTDEKGGMHFEVDLSDGSEVFPTEEVLMANIVGQGWTSNATYEYREQRSEKTGALLLKTFEESVGYPLYGGDMNRKFYFKDNSTATVFYKWGPYPVANLPYASKKDETYTYDVKKGLLAFDVLKGVSVVYTDKDNLWLARSSKYRNERIPAQESYWIIYHLKSVSASTLAEWERTYTD